MAITTASGLSSAYSNNTRCDMPLFIPSATTVAGGTYHLNRLTTSFGAVPTPAAITSGGQAYSSSLAGSFSFCPTSGQDHLIYGYQVAFSAFGSVTAYETVWGCSGFVGNVTTGQSLTGFTAYSGSSDGLQIWLESWTAIGATAANVTVSYTNQSGTAGRTTVSEAIIASFPAGRLQRLRLQEGDTGVQSIQSLTLSASTGTAGNFGILLMRPKFRMASVTAGDVSASVGVLSNLVPFPAESFMSLVHVGGAATTGTVGGKIITVKG